MEEQEVNVQTAESGSEEGAEKRPADKIPVGRNRVYFA